MTKRLLVGFMLLASCVLALQPTTALASTTDFWGMKVAGWQKYPQPVLPRQSGQWDSALTREISPVINDTDGKMTRGTGGALTAYYYGANGSDVRQVGKATSSDNGYTWTNRSVAIAPSGVNGSWYKTDIFQPTVVKRASDGMLLMMAVGLENETYDTGKIGVLTSDDGGATWDDGGSKLTIDMFEYENGDPITEFGVPRVIKRSSGDYLLVLEGQTANSNHWRVFAATSSTFTGTWTPLNDGKPILMPTSSTWEDIGVANAQLIEIESGAYVMAYNGRGTGAPGGWQVGFASSTDLVNWYRYPGNPVIKPGAATFDARFVETSFLAKADSYGQAKLYIQGYDVNESPQVGVATADWREFSRSWFGNDGLLYSRRIDGALQRIQLPLAASTSWEQIGAGWNQFPIMFSGRVSGDNKIYAVRDDGAFLTNQYSSSSWSGWTQIGSGWDQFPKVFMGTDGWTYAVRNDGVFFRNLYVNGSGWQGWQQIGSGWDQFTKVFMGTDGWIYAVRNDGLLFKNKYTSGSGWQGWSQIGSDWLQFTEVFPGPDNWIYAHRSDGHFFKNKYVDGTGWVGWGEI
jgi:hypothetical protein